MGRTEVCSVTCVVMAVFFMQKIAASEFKAPGFISEPRAAIVEKLSFVLLTCQTSPPANVFTWTLNDTVIASNKKEFTDDKNPDNLMNADFENKNLFNNRRNSKRQKIRNNRKRKMFDTFVLQENGSVLKIGPFDFERHQGFYRCVAWVEESGEVGGGVVVSSEALVEEAVLQDFSSRPQKMPTESNEYIIEVLESNVIVIPCDQPYSKPTVITQLEFNERPLQIRERMVVLPSGHVHISGASASDEGGYRCVAYNHILNRSVKSSYVYKVVVKKVEKQSIPASFSQKSDEKIVVTQGSDLTLECAVQSWPPVSTSWEKYGGHLPSGRVQFLLGNLVISNVQKFDAGTYLCRPNISVDHSLDPNQHVTNIEYNILKKSVTAESVTLVEVLEPPAIETWLTDQFVKNGGTVALKCKTRGNPKPRVKWYHNGRIVKKGQFVVVRDSTLTLSNANIMTKGVYQCFAQNKLGSVHSSAYISVSDFDAEESGAKTSQDGNNNVDYYEDYYPEDFDETSSDESFRQFSNKEPTEHRLIAPDRPSVSRIGESSVLINWTYQPENHEAELKNFYKNIPNNVYPHPYDPYLPNTELHDDRAVLQAFTIQYRDMQETVSMWNDFDVDLAPHLRQFQVDNLRINRAYRFRIMASYGRFGTKASEPSKDVFLDENPLLNLPSFHLPTPQIVETKSLSSSKIFVRWQLEGDTDKDIPTIVNGFHVFYAPSGKKFKKVTLSSHHIRHVVLSKLSKATSYNVRIQAFDSIGRESEGSREALVETLATNTKEDEHLMAAKSYDASRDFQGSIGSNQLMLVGVGLLLGFILLVVVACVILLAWKQRNSNKQHGSPSELSRLHNKLFGPKNDCLETSNACTNNMLNKNIDLLAFNVVNQSSSGMLMATTTTTTSSKVSTTNSSNSQQNNQTPLIVEQNYWISNNKQPEQLFYTGPAGIYSNDCNQNLPSINNRNTPLNIKTNNENFNYFSQNSPQSDYYSKVASSSDITAAIRQQQTNSKRNASNRPISQHFNNFKDHFTNNDDYNKAAKYNNHSTYTSIGNNETTMNRDSDLNMSSSINYPFNPHHTDSLCTELNLPSSLYKQGENLLSNFCENRNYNNIANNHNVYNILNNVPSKNNALNNYNKLNNYSSNTMQIATNIPSAKNNKNHSYRNNRNRNNIPNKKNLHASEDKQSPHITTADYFSSNLSPYTNHLFSDSGINSSEKEIDEGLTENFGGAKSMNGTANGISSLNQIINNKTGNYAGYSFHYNDNNNRNRFKKHEETSLKNTLLDVSEKSKHCKTSDNDLYNTRSDEDDEDDGYDYEDANNLKKNIILET